MSADEAGDRLAIREVIARYMRGIRTRDLDLLDDCFAPDGTIDYRGIGGTVASWPDTKEWLRGMVNVPLFMLYAGDVYPTFSDGGDAAEVETTWHGVFVAAEGAAPLVIFGTYHDRFVRTAGGWRIAHREDRPAVQVLSAGATGVEGAG